MIWVIIAVCGALLALVLFFQRREVSADIQAENLGIIIDQARLNEKINKEIEANAATTPSAAVSELRRMRAGSDKLPPGTLPS